MTSLFPVTLPSLIPILRPVNYDLFGGAVIPLRIGMIYGAAQRVIDTTPPPFDNRDLNIIFHGDSLSLETAGGGGTGYPLQAAAMFPGAAITVVAAGGKTLATMDAEFLGTIAPLFVPGKRNVYVLWGGTNDLYFGATVADVQASLASLSAKVRLQAWTFLFANILPRTNPGVPVTFEADRLTFDAWSRTQIGVLFDLLEDVGADTGRKSGIGIGDVAETASTYYYYSDGALDVGVHLNTFGAGIPASYVARSLRTAFGAPYDASHYPYGSYWTPIASKVLDGAGLPITDGANVGTFYAVLAPEAGAFVQAVDAKRVTWSQAGFGGRSALTMSPTKWMASATIATLGQGLMAVTAKIFAAGPLLEKPNPAPTDVRFIGDDAPAAVAYEFDSGAMIGSLKSAGAGTIVDPTPHVLIHMFDGLDAEHLVTKDGTPIVLTTVPPYNSDTGAVPTAGLLYLGGNDGDATLDAQIGEIVCSPVYPNAADLADLVPFLKSLRGIV